MVEDNIRLIPRLDNKGVAAGMHLVLLVALVVLNIMDQKEGMVVAVVGGDIRLECEVWKRCIRKGSRRILWYVMTKKRFFLIITTKERCIYYFFTY